MAVRTMICSRCGRQIVLSTSQKFSNKIYCIPCYNKLIEEEEALEKAKEELYNFIKELFGLQECPTDIIYNIESLLNQGKKARGIYLTLRYYFLIEGHQPSNINFLTKIIREQYENAKNYAMRQKELKIKNQGVVINPPSVNIKMTSPVAETRRKPSYRM